MDLIGRTAELAHVGDRLRDRRLVTLVGPGGIGKTTLARAAAARAATDHDGGTIFVDLTRVSTEAGVRESLATQLGFSSFAALLDFPADTSVLLVVDNCEHVLDAVAEAIDTLLSVCQMPTVLATSRAALEVPGETVVPIGPLTLPPVGTLEAPAVQLFLDRARDAGQELAPSEAIAELCRRLDGMPLAIELAAARTRAMTPEEVLARLSGDLGVLDRPRRRSAPRHQSVRAAIDWSYELLPLRDQERFAHLSILPGAFDAAMAHALSGHPDESMAATQDALDRLVAASMVVADATGPAMRYRILGTLRAYGSARLEATGVVPTLEARFVDQVVTQVADVITRGATSWSPDAMADLRGLYDSAAAVIRWCVDHDDEPGRAFLLVAALWGIVHQAHTEDVGALAEAVLARWPSSDDPLRSDAVATAATCRYMLGDDDGAEKLAQAALTEAEHSPFAPATLRRAIAQARRASGDAEGALEWFAATEVEARRLGMQAMAMESRSARAQVLSDLGRGDEALAIVAAVHDEADAVGAEVLIAWVKVIEGSILLRADPTAARPCLEEGLAACRRLDHHAGTSVARRSLAIEALLAGRIDDAASHVLELLDGLLELGSTYELRMALDVASAVAARSGRRTSAADLAATALALPVVSITASVGYELFTIDASGGRARSTRDAILLLRSEMEAVLADDAPTDSAGPTAAGAFRRTGELWEVGLGEVRATVKASKGMDDLAVLLAAEGREVHCLELIGGGLDQGDAGPALDDTARRAYEQRVRDLQAEIDEADDHNDRGRSDQARVELDALVDELTSALGLASRPRSTGSSAERARSTVTQRIRTTIRRLEAVDPRLGRHLQASIRTGTFCSYAPEHPVRWDR